MFFVIYLFTVSFNLDFSKIQTVYSMYRICFLYIGLSKVYIESGIGFSILFSNRIAVLHAMCLERCCLNYGEINPLLKFFYSKL